VIIVVVDGGQGANIYLLGVVIGVVVDDVLIDDFTWMMW
jgi:hypothetical protein